MSPNEYHLNKLLGCGAFGEVYQAIHKKSRLHYAIKIVDFEETLDVRRFLAEIQTLSKIRSEYLNRYYQTFQDGTKMWIVLEYCEGGLCYDLIKGTGPLSEDVASYVIKNVLLGADYLHQQNRIHRDIKLANVLITRNGHIKLGDFGVSTEISYSQKYHMTVIGTPHWMAPEMLKGSGYDYKADVWSIGITAFELLTGHAPTHGLSVGDALSKITTVDPLKLQGNFSDRSKSFMECCLVKDPEYRPGASVLLQHRYITTSTGDAKTMECLVSLKKTTGEGNRRIHRKKQSRKPVQANEPISWEFPPETKEITAAAAPKAVSQPEDLIQEACTRLYKRAKCDRARQFVLQLQRMFLEGESQNTGLCAAFAEDLFIVYHERRTKGR